MAVKNIYTYEEKPSSLMVLLL